MPDVRLTSPLSNTVRMTTSNSGQVIDCLKS